LPQGWLLSPCEFAVSPASIGTTTSARRQTESLKR